MNKYITAILCSFFILSYFQVGFCEKTNNDFGVSDEQYQKLVEFSKKMHQVKEKYERGGAFKKDVKEIVGDPAFVLKDKSEWAIQVEDQKDEWQYWHPCYASVSYIFIFNKDDRLVMISCRQLQNPANYCTYHDVDYFLPKDK